MVLSVGMGIIGFGNYWGHIFDFDKSDWMVADIQCSSPAIVQFKDVTPTVPQSSEMRYLSRDSWISGIRPVSLFACGIQSLSRLAPPALKPRIRELPPVSRAQDVNLVAGVHMQRERHVYPLLTEGLVPAGQLGAVGVELFDPPVRGPAGGFAPRAGPIAGDIDVLCAIDRDGAGRTQLAQGKALLPGVATIGAKLLEP